MLRVALVGCGFMGRTHYGCWNALDGVEVTAVCHRDPDRLKQTYRSGGNIDRAESRIEFDELRLYSDFDRMVEAGDMDAVSITLPTDLHAEYSIRALDSGLHVFCEKPVALNVAAGIAEMWMKTERISRVISPVCCKQREGSDRMWNVDSGWGG